MQIDINWVSVTETIHAKQTGMPWQTIEWIQGNYYFIDSESHNSFLAVWMLVYSLLNMANLDIISKQKHLL